MGFKLFRARSDHTIQNLATKSNKVKIWLTFRSLGQESKIEVLVLNLLDYCRREALKKLVFSLHFVTWKSRSSLRGFKLNCISVWNQATENPCSSVGMRAAPACDHRGQNVPDKTMKSISRHKACRLLVIEPVRSHTWENLVVLYHILSGNLKSTLRNSYLSVWVRSDTNVYLEQMNVSRTTYLVVNIIILQFVLLGKILLPKLVCFGILFGKVVHFWGIFPRPVATKLSHKV